MARVLQIETPDFPRGRDRRSGRNQYAKAVTEAVVLLAQEE